MRPFLTAISKTYFGDSSSFQNIDEKVSVLVVAWYRPALMTNADIIARSRALLKKHPDSLLTRTLRDLEDRIPITEGDSLTCVRDACIDPRNPYVSRCVYMLRNQFSETRSF